MTSLAQQLTKACLALDLPIDVGFVADFGGGKRVKSVARIRNLGADNGMLIIHDFDEVRGCLDQLLVAGYGYSVLSEPGSEDAYDADGCRELFSEWGWSGPADRIPNWFLAPVEEPPETDLEVE